MTTSFGNKLLKWHESIDRELPWKNTKDPYKIWLSEIILQQTRVAQGTPYYLKFIRLFPTVNDLAQADEETVMLAWQGLGYYSRARNLHFAAKTIVNLYNSKFPDQYADILGLKGVGEYTAAAIASFAYDLPYPVLDGNVKRVIARYFGITQPIDQSKTISDLKTKLDMVFEPRKAAAFNQAIMDFGALHCTPSNPSCGTCPFNDTCQAFLQGLISIIPFKSKKIKKRNRYIHYIVISDQTKTIVNRRDKKDIWKGLYDFPSIELENSHQLPTQCIESKILEIVKLDKVEFKVEKSIKLNKHILTHQNLYIEIHKVKIGINLSLIDAEFIIVDSKNHQSLAFPIILSKHIDIIMEN